jgi:hypothetical protein
MDIFFLFWYVELVPKICLHLSFTLYVCTHIDVYTCNLVTEGEGQ